MGCRAVLSLRRLGRDELALSGRDGLLGVLGDIERLANRLAGYRVEVLDALGALSRTGAAPDAAPHLSLRDAAGVSERQARQMVRVAEKVQADEGVLAALSGGDVNAAQAEALCDARVPEEVRAGLTRAAAGENADQTRRRIRRAEAEHSAETALERFERQRNARGAGWQRDHEGMLRLWAKFDPDCGAHIEAALDALRRQFWNDDKQVRNGRRTPAQRDADALAYALAGLAHTDADAAAADRLHARARRRGHLPEEPPPSRSARRSPDPSHEGRGRLPEEPPASRRTTPPDSAATDAGETGWAGADANCDLSWRLPPAQISVLIGLDALRGHTDQAGLTDAGTELPPEVVRRLACDAEIIPVILNSPGGPADVGRSCRTVPLRLRRLLIARDRHCQWPGCAAPPSRCDAHHIIHWANGGPTDLGNLVLLCHTHHRHLHEHGHQIVPQPDGTWAVTRQPQRQPTPQRTQRSRRQPRAP